MTQKDSSYQPEKIWRITFDPRTSLLDTAIHRLRNKLGDEGGAPTIEAVRGVDLEAGDSERELRRMKEAGAGTGTLDSLDREMG